MEALEAVHQHGTISFLEDVASNLDDAIGADSEEVTIERRMVELAQCEPVRHERLTQRISVGDDVRCVEQLVVVEAAQGTGLTVRMENADSERALV